MAEDTSKIIAHRGFRACYPENTLAAFSASLGRCAMIELDLQLSRDNQVVVVHDSTLARTSDAASVAPRLGQAGLVVRDWTLAQLRRLDFGSWFLDADPFGAIRQGRISRETLLPLLPQRIMTLSDLLAWARDKGVALNLELKDFGSSGDGDLLVSLVAEEVRASGPCRVLVSCFNHELLRRFRQLAPEIPLAALQQDSHPPDLIHYLRHLGVVAYHPENSLCDAQLARTLRAEGFLVHVFTVNDPVRQQELIGCGVNGIFTDFPGQKADSWCC